MTLPERLGRDKGGLDVYRRAGDYVWDMYRPTARFMEAMPSKAELRRDIETFTDKARMDVRIGR